jgi:hypothetical protein
VLVDLARTYVRLGKHAAVQAIQARLADLTDGEPLRTILEDALKRLQRLRRDVCPVEGGRAGGAVLMGYPTPDGNLRLFLVRDGRLIARQTAQPGTSTAKIAQRLVRPATSAASEHEPGRPCQGHDGTCRSTDAGHRTSDFGLRTSNFGLGAAGALDADQTNILLRWLHHHLGRPEVLPLPAEAGADEIAGAVEALVACAQTLQEPDVEAEVVDGGEALGADVFDFEEVP